MGLKLFTKPHSIQVRLDKGGKNLIKDNKKPSRIYKIKGEK